MRKHLLWKHKMQSNRRGTMFSNLWISFFSITSFVSLKVHFISLRFRSIKMDKQKRNSFLERKIGTMVNLYQIKSNQSLYFYSNLFFGPVHHIQCYLMESKMSILCFSWLNFCAYQMLGQRNISIEVYVMRKSFTAHSPTEHHQMRIQRTIIETS